ncbi:MAG: histidinol-phosphatase [Pseudomonadales bacterium]|jgi:histidinol-phosphatase (PHP family)|nr:histidinol-phosphatase [Pseudomonadales bacterium]MDP7145650.1 histidinol-phosphatase [Pseudomonadales bacterium]MDP7360786.1 histidinol-phosphatase [Pseudomonadales bacterium]MDP7595058.1 histidinol-phosphatase [Pseudomonadales bacterium]HJN50749.1 histidinol-phosphatase [Pseudomonadales bacterium]|tara:strand:- start:577 stop:1425 length:849 start_codon:yes stop_codon:yes gene_type:complete
MHEPVHNFHTHTYRCKHAQGDVADYCQVALEQGMETLGFSDHSALPDDRWITARMHYAELPDYSSSIDQAKLDFPQLRILKGMECEYIPEFHAFYAEELLGEHKFDYLIGAAHLFPNPSFSDRANNEERPWLNTYGGTSNPKMLRAYADYLIQMMATGLFDFIAHPDLFGNCYLNWDEDTTACSRDIISAAADLKVGLEINALGLRKIAYKKPDNPYPMYPWIPFWEEATDFPVEVIVNSDAHRPIDVQARMTEAQAIHEKLNLVTMNPEAIGARQFNQHVI